MQRYNMFILRWDNYFVEKTVQYACNSFKKMPTEGTVGYLPHISRHTSFNSASHFHVLYYTNRLELITQNLFDVHSCGVKC